MRQALFLTRDYPPYVSNGSSRAWKLANNLSEIGWVPFVVAPPSISGVDGGADAGKDHTAGLFRVGAPVSPAKLKPEAMNDLLHGNASRSLRPVNSRFFGRSQGGAAWAKAAAAEVEKLLEAHPDIDLLYAAGPPVEPLMLALETARKHSLSVVLDITGPLDPAMPAPGTLSNSREAHTESTILLSGVPMIMPTRALKEYFLKKYAGRLDHGLLTIVPPSFDGEAIASRKPARSDGPGSQFRVALMVGEQPGADCKALLKGIESWIRMDGIRQGDIELLVFGEGAFTVSKRVGRNPIRQFLKIDLACGLAGQYEHCRNTDFFCVALGRQASNSCMLPERLVELAGMGMPFGGIVPDGSALRFLEEVGGWYAAAGDPSAIADMFRSVSACRRDRTLSGVSAETIGNYAARAVVREMTQAIAIQPVA